MKENTIQVLSAVRMHEVAEAVALDFHGYAMVVGGGLLKKTAYFHFNGKGLIVSVKDVPFGDLALIAEAHSGSVADFVSTFSKRHPSYKPVQLTKGEWVRFKKYGGKEDNLHPIEIV